MRLLINFVSSLYRLCRILILYLRSKGPYYGDLNPIILQEAELLSGRSGRVFRAPFAGWTPVTYHGIRGKRVAVSKNTFGGPGSNSPEEAMSSYTMDDSTAL